MNPKIAFICSSKAWGGLEMNHVKSALWLQEKGYNVLLFCQQNTPIEKFAIENKIAHVYIEEHKRYKYFFAGLNLRKSLKKNQISHLIVRNSSDLNICSIAKTFSKNKFSSPLRWRLIYFMEMQLGVSKKNFLHTSRFKKIDSWICSTQFLKNQVLKFTKFPENKIKILPPPIDLSVFQQEISKQEAREKLGLSKTSITLGLIGRLDILKGQLTLLKALKILDNQEITVCFMGSETLNETSEYSALLKQFIVENNLESQVVFLPFQPEVVYFYKAIDLCIMASKSETFGMVTIESLASGTDVIGSNSGGTTEILQNGELGILFEPESEHDLAEKINLFLKQEKKNETEKFKMAMQKYDLNRFLKEFELLLA
ncbi:MAG: glycosyltransferase [Bacteroidota bacterium]